MFFICTIKTKYIFSFVVHDCVVVRIECMECMGQILNFIFTAHHTPPIAWVLCAVSAYIKIHHCNIHHNWTCNFFVLSKIEQKKRTHVIISSNLKFSHNPMRSMMARRFGGSQIYLLIKITIIAFPYGFLVVYVELCVQVSLVALHMGMNNIWPHSHMVFSSVWCIGLCTTFKFDEMTPYVLSMGSIFDKMKNLKVRMWCVLCN